VIRHPEFKFFVANTRDIGILNTTVAISLDPEYATENKLS
jgi:hypothetical protein